MAIIKAPWNDEQVEKLENWQAGMIAQPIDGGLAILTVHPFTCCGHEGCDRSTDDGILRPTNDGWVCPCGKYKQDWCHDFMVGNNAPEPVGKSLNKYALDLMKIAFDKGWNEYAALMALYKTDTWRHDEYYFFTIVTGMLQLWLRREHKVTVWAEPTVPVNRFFSAIHCEHYLWHSGSLFKPAEWEDAMIKGLTHALENL